jgi:hypothetical protein
MRSVVMFVLAASFGGALAACDKPDAGQDAGGQAAAGNVQFLKEEPGPTPEPKDITKEPRDPRTGETASEKADREAREKEREKNPEKCNVTGGC